jgi:cytosine/adenosine deaminase-related metal-dependent hydrolase
VRHNPSLLIQNAHAILTGETGCQARSTASDLRIRNGVITEMGRGLRPEPGEQILDATDCVIYPGWVNTHHHLFQSILKGVPAGIDKTLSPWLQAVPFTYRRFLDERGLRLAARIGLIELMRSGCTTIADHHYVYAPDLPYDPSAVLFEEAQALGIRFMLHRGCGTVVRTLEANDRNYIAPETLDGYFASMERTAARFHQTGPRPRSRLSFAPTTANVSVLPDELRAIAAEARRLGLTLHTHMSESVSSQEHCRARFGQEPIEFLAEHDWLGPDVLLAHIVHLSDAEMRLLGETGTAMAHCPQSNARLADGIAAAPRLEELGATITLGVDGASSNEAADMISEVHFCWLVHRAHAGSKTCPAIEGSGEAGADATTAEQVIRWATKSGARAMGFEDIGTLAVGQAADCAVYDLDDPRYFGLHDIALGPVISGGRPHLKWLVADGRIVVEHDSIPGFDMAALRREAAAEVARMTREV